MRFFSLPIYYTLTIFTYLCLQASPTQAQEYFIVKGKVTYQNKGMAGVNIFLKSIKRVTFTQEDGTYQITVPKTGTQKLEFSLKGFAKVTKKVNQSQVIDVVLEKKAPLLKPNQTYPTQRLREDALTYSTDIFKGIQNRVAGAWVTSSSGSPGAATQLLLRGHRSINGKNSPLILLDGMPINNLTIGNSTSSVDQTNRLMDINPHDIASVEVIPAFSARLLGYGTLARNGAIILTSKKGALNSKPRVTFYNRFSVEDVNKLPALQNTYAQGLPQAGVALHLGPESRSPYSWGPALATRQYDGIVTPYSREGTLIPLSGGTPATPYNPYDFFVQGFTFDTHVAVSGGNKDKQYYLSAGRMQQNGFIHTIGFYRNSLNLGIRQKLSARLTATGKISIFNTRGQRAHKGSSGASIPLGIMRTPPSFDNSYGNGSSRQASRTPSTFTVLSNNIPRSSSTYIVENPHGSINRNPYGNVMNGQLFQASLDWDISEHWQLTAQALLDNRNDVRSIGFDSQTTTSFVGRFEENTISMSSFHINTALSYRTRLWNKLDIGASIGYFSNNQDISTIGAFATPLNTQGVFTLNNGLETGSINIDDSRKIRNLYMSASANYLKIVTLDIGVLNVGHSLLTMPKFTPSAALGVDFAQMLPKKSKLINQLKLGVQYSQVASDADVYTYSQSNINRTQLLFGVGIFDLDINSSDASSIYGIRPEITTSVEYRADIALFNRRFRASAAHYQTTTTDQVIALSSSSQGDFLSNGGTLNNQGWEFQLGGELIKTKAVTWYIGANLTRFNTRVSDLPQEVDNIHMGGVGGLNPIYSSVTNGHPYGVIHGRYYQRNEQGELIINNQGLPALGVAGAVGDPTPDWLWGIETNFNWKGFSIGMRWDIRRGGDIWNGTLANLDFVGMSQRSGELRSVTNYIYPGVKLDGTPNDIPVNFYNLNATQIAEVSPFTFYGQTGIAEAYLQDGSWLRLRELTVAYTLPAKWMKNWLISELTISFIGRNLFLATDYTGVDPETNLTGTGSGFGVDLFNMPQTKSIGGAVMMRF